MCADCSPGACSYGLGVRSGCRGSERVQRIERCEAELAPFQKGIEQYVTDVVGKVATAPAPATAAAVAAKPCDDMYDSMLRVGSTNGTVFMMAVGSMRACQVAKLACAPWMEYQPAAAVLDE